MTGPDPAPPPLHAEAQAEFLGALDVRLDLPLASVGSRGMAQWVDLWVAGGLVVVVAATAITAGLLASQSLGEDALGVVLALGAVASFLAQWGYFFGFELAWRGQTPGKRLFGLRVVTLDGGVPGVVPTAIRNLVRVLDLLPGAYGIGAVAMLLSRRGQRLGDLAAGTVVIRADELEAQWRPTRRWPAALGAAEIALLERWERRAPHLLPAARDELAGLLVARLRARAPGLLPAEAGPAELQALLAAAEEP